MPRRSSGVLSGLSSTTSTVARMTASGVRSSWEALAMNRCWPSKAAWSRSSISSKVSASSWSSSRGPRSATRADRLRSDAARAAAVIRCTGRSARPAAIQPRIAARAITTASVISEYCRRCERVTSRWCCAPWSWKYALHLARRRSLGWALSCSDRHRARKLAGACWLCPCGSSRATRT